MMLLDNKYEIGDMVYLKIDPDQMRRMVVGLMLTSVGLLYLVRSMTGDDTYSEIEITSEKTVYTEDL